MVDKGVWIFFSLTVLFFIVGCYDQKEVKIMEKEIKTSLNKQGDKIFTYKIENKTNEVKIYEFTSSQRVDYTILSTSGEEVYNHSSVSMFMQVMGLEEIKPNEFLEYKIDLNQLEPGEYVLKVWLTPIEGSKLLVEEKIEVK